MLAKILKIEPLCTPSTSFFTIKFEGKSVSEFKDFVSRLSAHHGNREELFELNAIIQEIGERGAQRRYFNREENNAHALPPKQSQYIESIDFGIRLYCVVLNKRIVFLLNGDRKKTLKATDPASNVGRYFHMANSLFTELLKDKLDKVIHWDEDGVFEFDPDYLINVQG